MSVTIGKENFSPVRFSISIAFSSPSPVKEVPLVSWMGSHEKWSVGEVDRKTREAEVLRAQVDQARLDLDQARQDLTRQAHSRVVQITEDYALAHTAERLYVTDLCEAAGVSERTFRRWCERCGR